MGPVAPCLRFVIAHSGDSSDPELLHWIKDRIDQIVGPAPWLVVSVIALLIVTIPVAVVVFYLFQRRHQNTHVRGPSDGWP